MPVLGIVGFAVAGFIMLLVAAALFWRKCEKCERWTAIRYPSLALGGTDELPEHFYHKCLRLIRCGYKYEEVQ